MGTVKKITIITIIGAAVVGTFKKLALGKKCYGIKVRRKHFWNHKQNPIGILFISIMKLFRFRKESRSMWKKIIRSA